MDRGEVSNSRKIYFSKKSQRFRDLAHNRWSMRLRSHVVSDVSPEHPDTEGENNTNLDDNNPRTRLETQSVVMEDGNGVNLTYNIPRISSETQRVVMEDGNDGNIPGTSSETQMEDGNDVSLTCNTTRISSETQRVVMEDGNDDDIPGTSPETQNIVMDDGTSSEGQILMNAYNGGVPQRSVSVTELYDMTSTESDSTLSTSETDTVDSSSEYCPTPLKKARASPVELGNSVFLCQATQLQEFIDQINATTVCYTPECTGKLIPINVKFLGLGGCAMVKFKCSGCAERMINLTSSVNVAFSNRMACSLAMQVAFIASGLMHSQYNKVLKQGLGMSAVSTKSFYETIKLLHPIVNTMINEMCEMAKGDMKSLDPSAVGSWQRAITTSDGAWLTRGRYSQNCTFTIRNYVTNSLLYFVHLCMRGKGVDQDQLYRGTAKGAEGHAADIAFGHAKEEGMMIEVQWQDGDSSSAKAFRMHYTDAQKSKVMLCGGHVARSHTKHLGEIAKQKSFSETMQDVLKEKFPEVTTVKCHCPKRHKKNCGCLSKSFLRGARTNFFYCLLQAETDPQFFAARILALGKYHARDIHIWEGGHCDFHSMKVCSCGNCEGDTIACEGEDYHSKNPLACPFHALAYEVECSNRASQAPQIIHTELGRGHSNYPEASHNVLIRYRSKDKYLHSIHYMLSTNMGLMQANMTWLNKKYGMSYHWLLELFRRLRLPLFDGMAAALQRGNEVRANNLERKKTEEAKENRTNWKKARVQEQEERKQWIRRQRIQHTYGSDDEDDGDDDDLSDNCDVANNELCATSSRKQGKCKCGSATHRITSHRDCPLNKNHQVRFEDESTASETEIICTCGSERGTHNRSCPLNPRNLTRL